MTDPVILLGTQSNGETLPVQVDGFGRLVAEGLQGSEGPQGPQGPQGPIGPPGPGGGIELPPDPYEGALLGWLNNELAWIGSPPVPIPEGVFGPISSYSQENGLVEVEGSIPETITTGVYVYQCDNQGNYATDNCLTNKTWSDLLTADRQFLTPVENAFDGDNSTFASCDSGGTLFLQLNMTVEPYSSIEMWSSDTEEWGTEMTVTVDGVATTLPGGGFKSVDYNNGTNISTISIVRKNTVNSAQLRALKINGKLLVNPTQGAYIRVNQVQDQMIIGSPNPFFDFTPGYYLFVPSQRVAPWLLYGSDPTSLIDHLRSS